MSIEFDITLSSKDMFRFNMYQTYSGFHGWFSVILSVLLFVVAGTTYGDVEMTYTILYAAFGVVFLVYIPFSLWMRSKTAITSSEVLSKPLHYAVGEEGFVVSQGEASAQLPWDQIYKFVSNKRNVLVYSNRTNAYVIPREQLGEQYAPLKEIVVEKLPKYRVGMKA